MLGSSSGHPLVGLEHLALPAGLQRELILLQEGLCPAWTSPPHSRPFLSSSVPRSEGTTWAYRMLHPCGEPPACPGAGGLWSMADPWWVLAQLPCGGAKPCEVEQPAAGWSLTGCQAAFSRASRGTLPRCLTDRMLRCQSRFS